MASMLDWKLSLLIEEQKITNILSGNIAILLRIPDFQKERYDYVEKGIRFFKNAIYDPDLYENSLKYLLKAEEKEPEDFYVLHLIGLIYLYSHKHLDLPKAEIYFKQAAKYAIVETNDGANVTTNFLRGDVNKNLISQEPTNDYIKLQAAEAYMYAGRCCYIQGKFNDAAELAGKAFRIVPQMVEAGFTQAKALSANNSVIQAATILESVINTDRLYSLITLFDLDLAPKEPIRKTLEKIRRQALTEASERYNRCKAKILSDSKAKELLNKIELLINRNTFLDSKQAIDLLDKKINYSFDEALEKNSLGKWEYKVKPMNLIFPIEELVDYEVSLNSSLNKVKELISYNDIKTELASELNSKLSSKSSFKSDIESLLYGLFFTAFFIGSLFAAITVKENGNWFHDKIGLVLFDISAFLTFIGASILFYLYFTQEKTGSKNNSEIKELKERIEEVEKEIQLIEKILD